MILSTQDRAAFLAGEGTLTLGEVREWAAEMGEPNVVAIGFTDDEPMMVSVVRWVPKNDDDAGETP